MSVLRPIPSIDPIRCDPSSLFAACDLGSNDLETLFCSLDTVRQECSKGSLAEVLTIPEQLLGDYSQQRSTSSLFQILQVARNIREAVDRVVLLGDGITHGIRLLLRTCCHPFHNELSRGDRGGRPRLTFAPYPIDNDSFEGLLDLLLAPASNTDLLDRWSVLAIDSCGTSLDAAAASRVLLARLTERTHAEHSALGFHFHPLAHHDAPLMKFARALGYSDTFELPERSGGHLIFSAAGLVPASIVGIDVVRLLEGAAAMSRRFRESPPHLNPVLQFVGACRISQQRFTLEQRHFQSNHLSLAGLGNWYRSLEMQQRPLQAPQSNRVPIIDRYSSFDSTLIHLKVSHSRRDRLRLPPMDRTSDELDRFVGSFWQDLPEAFASVESLRCKSLGQPSVNLLIEQIDEYTVGQLLQLFSLSFLMEHAIHFPNETF